MVGTQVTLAPDVSCAVVVGAPQQAVALFLDHGMLVLDDVAWEADMAVIRSGLVKKRRDFKKPFIEAEPSKDVRKQVRNVVLHAEQLFRQLYPGFVVTKTRTSFRPMITGPEPLHFDTYGGPSPLVTAYINVSSVPRVYGIGANFPALVAEQPAVMHEMVQLAAARDDADLSYVIRQRTGGGLPPLGTKAPRHRVALAPGAIWFFNAKTVSHEVVYGEGTIGVSWEVPNCGAAMQIDLIKGLL